MKKISTLLLAMALSANVATAAPQSASYGKARIGSAAIALPPPTGTPVDAVVAVLVVLYMLFTPTKAPVKQ